MNVKRIEKSNLVLIEPLLKESYGSDDFSIQDELDYFVHEEPCFWFYLEDKEHKPLGFIRSFSDCNKFESMEFYLPSEDFSHTAADLLLKTWLKANTKLCHKELIFRTKNSSIAKLLVGFFPETTVRSFLFLQLFQDSQALGNTKEFKASKSDNILTPYHTSVIPAHDSNSSGTKNSLKKADFERIQSTLSVLKTYSIAELENLLAKDRLLLQIHDQKIVGALHFQSNLLETEVEIIAIASHPDSLRRGFAKALLNKLIQKFQLSPTMFTLKVDSENRQGIALYQSMGFKQDLFRTESWVYCNNRSKSV